ncbi:MAG: hypothetical protein JW881_18350 [Spirochaetales bacterium]|nr:hypothetical protein [Spirochaetales bacterium]
MKKGIIDQFDINLENYLIKERLLEERIGRLDFEYSGLKDLDDLFELIIIKLTIALHCITALKTNIRPSETENIQELAQTKSQKAVQMLESLLDSGISEDQKHIVNNAPGYEKAKELLHEFLLEGGGYFFQSTIKENKSAKIFAAAIVDAIKKYDGPDETYEPVLDPEKLPGFLRKIIETFLPVLAPGNQKGPPYGIDEGEEYLRRSNRMRMPLSQAVHYLENELLPQLKKELCESPGSKRLQQRISETEHQINELKRLRFLPRSSPVFPEKNYYTDAISGYTENGELLVTLHIPVIYPSGTNLSRMQEMVKAEITRRLAGKGVCPELDRHYFFLKSLESGRRGSSRTPSMKLDTAMGFSLLKNRYPFLKLLERKDLFKRLLGLVRRRGVVAARRTVLKIITSDGERFTLLE